MVHQAKLVWVYVIDTKCVSDILTNGELRETKDEWVSHRTRDSQVTGQLDSVFDLLRSSRRRYLLYYLNDSAEAVHSLEEVVEAVRQYEVADTEAEELPPRQSVRTNLVHAHLPRLASMGVLEHDATNGTVRFCGYAPLEEWLERARQLELD